MNSLSVRVFAAGLGLCQLGKLRRRTRCRTNNRTPDRTNTCQHSVGWYGKRCHWTSAAAEFTRSKSMASTAGSAIGSSQSDMAKCKEFGGSMIAIEFQ